MKLYEQGFSMVELLLGMAIASILMGFVTLNLLNAKHTTSLTTTVDSLISDMRSQQMKAMAGTSLTTSSSTTYGVYIESNDYILFRGTYNPNDTANVKVPLDGVNLSTTFPSNTISFSQQTGEVGSGSNTVTVKDQTSTQQKIVTVNRYGVVTSIQ